MRSLSKVLCFLLGAMLSIPSPAAAGPDLVVDDISFSGMACGSITISAVIVNQGDATASAGWINDIEARLYIDGKWSLLDTCSRFDDIPPGSRHTCVWGKTFFDRDSHIIDIFVDAGYIVAVMTNYDRAASPVARSIKKLLERTKQQ